MRKAFLVFIFLLTACSGQTSSPLSSSDLQPYFTSTPAGTATPNFIPPDTPVPTSTPQTYTIQQGDTISELADTFRIPQNELLAANPNIDPNNMAVGQTLLIPDGSSLPAAASTPPPVPAPVTQTVCHPTADSGLWCFALIENNTADYLENVSAQITLLDSQGLTIASQVAVTPLDIIPPNTSMPVYVFFANTPASATPQVKLLSAIQTNVSGSRYLPALLDNTLALISNDGLTAQLSGQIYLPPESKAATQVWVAAVLYDEDGIVIGVKRWEGGEIQPGAKVNFNFAAAGLRSRIEAVEFFVEAK